MSMSAGQSEDYWELRDEMLTSKFRLQDYGGAFITASLGLFVFTRNGKLRIVSPKSRRNIIALATLLPFITIASYIFDLLQAYSRGEFPHWADSLGIPLASDPIQFVLLLIWSLIHLGFLRRGYDSPTPLAFAVSLKTNWWLIVISFLTIPLVIYSAILGQYWYMLPSFLWIYLYLSFGTISHAKKVDNNIVTTGSNN